MTDVDIIIADYHAGRAERDPYDDLGVLVAEVKRLREGYRMLRGRIEADLNALTIADIEHLSGEPGLSRGSYSLLAVGAAVTACARVARGDQP